MTTNTDNASAAQQAADRIAQALRPIDDDGQSHGGPDGWSPTAEEIGEWQDYFHECASPEALRALLAERTDASRLLAEKEGELKRLRQAGWAAVAALERSLMHSTEERLCGITCGKRHDDVSS
jgi:hypothetical protein